MTDRGRDGSRRTAGPTRDRAQYGLCAFLALVGVVVLVDAARIEHATAAATTRSARGRADRRRRRC